MKRNSLLGAVAAVLLTGLGLAVEPGDVAPAFTAESTTGTVSLTDYQGKKHVVLAFYFKDFTGG